MKLSNAAPILLALLTAVLCTRPAGAATWNVPENLADCLREGAGNLPSQAGCEDFFAVLHKAGPLIGSAPVPLARPSPPLATTKSDVMQAAMPQGLPLARPNTPATSDCIRTAAHFSGGRRSLESDGLHYADRSTDRETRVAFSVPPSCRIESPLTGEVVFADNFAGYGGTVILQDNAGNHLVLAGFDELRVARGESVERGSLLGRIAAQKPRALMDMFAAPGALLYLEIRSPAGRIDPVRWLAGNS